MTQAGYFDYAASSPATPACLAAYAAYDRETWAGANPSALHAEGRAAARALEAARADLARCMGAHRPSEVIFTSGGTESNNMALEGIMGALRDAGAHSRRRVLISAIEHKSVLQAAERLERGGIHVDTIPVTRDGAVDLEALDELMGDDVALVSVMAANNEIGTVQPLEDIVDRAHRSGALVHTDAVQAFGHIPFDVGRLGVDSASFAAHKLGGPVGTGALYLKARTPLSPLIVGGGQEGGMRAGTSDVRGACAFAAAACDALGALDERSAYVHGLADVLIEQICVGPAAPARLTVELPHDERFLPGILHILVPGHQSEDLIMGLDEMGYAVAGGPACSSDSRSPSHVLTALGIPRDLAFCALRLSFDFRTTKEACLGLASALRSVVAARS